MNTQELWDILENNAITRLNFAGVYPKDLIKISDSLPYFIICNTDTSKNEGLHWICFYHDENNIMEYFDSLGKKMEYYGNAFKQLFYNSGATTLKQSSVQLQSSNSKLCGEYCLYFLYSKCMGNTMNNIVHNFPCENTLQYTVRYLYKM